MPAGKSTEKGAYARNPGESEGHLVRFPVGTTLGVAICGRPVTLRPNAAEESDTCMTCAAGQAVAVSVASLGA